MLLYDSICLDFDNIIRCKTTIRSHARTVNVFHLTTVMLSETTNEDKNNCKWAE